MARKKKISPGEDFFDSLVELSVLLPYWVTIPLAALLFIFIPFDLGTLEVSATENIAWFFVSIFLKALFKYFIPFALVIGVVIKILNGAKSQLIFSDISKRGVAKVLSDLSWQDFEFLLSEYFKKQGYNTKITGGGGADGGIDIKMYKNGELHLVQCKHFKSWKVSVHIVREFFGVMTSENAVSGYVVTSGKFTTDALIFAKGKNIELIDGRDLVKMFDESDVEVAKGLNNKPDTCPKCGGKLVERESKFGKFMGCDNYPKCNFTADIT